MTRLIARLVLAMLLLPLSGAVFVILLSTLFARAGGPTALACTVTWAAVYLFIGVYWVWLWRGSVQWTRSRWIQTLASAPAAMAIGSLIGLLFVAVFHVPIEPATLIAGGVPPIVWVLATVLIWRETPQERVSRITAAGTDSVCCPICGYNMTGLYEARCPECGSRFTLDQVLSSQPHRDKMVLHQG